MNKLISQLIEQSTFILNELNLLYEKFYISSDIPNRLLIESIIRAIYEKKLILITFEKKHSLSDVETSFILFCKGNFKEVYLELNKLNL
jgi:hypothetical protein